MTGAKLSAQKQAVFQEMVWRLMGNLQDAHWRDMLDSATPLGRWIRERYEGLAAASEDTSSLLAQSAAVDMFIQNVHPLAAPDGLAPAGGQGDRSGGGT
jgi:hypothetical protein